MRRPCRLICILLALALLSGCSLAAAPEAAPAAPVTLWVWDGEPLAEALRDFAEQYAAERPQSPVEVRVFESEYAMADAMNETRPDLALCPGERAIALYAQQKLREADTGAAFADALLACDESVGHGFFPLGAELPVLAVNAAGYLASPVTSGVGEGALEHIESLCSLAAAHGLSTGQPFLAASSWAAFFALYLRQGGEDFDGRRASLAASEHGAALYNLLAEAAYDRGLYVGAEDAADLVRRGYVTCALLPSRAVGRDRTGLTFYPAPALDGGVPLVPARLWGLAVTAADDEALPAVNAFLAWLLEPERLAALALDEGLLPAVLEDAESPEADGTLEQALLLTTVRARLVLADDAADWRQRAEDFDADLRDALALLD